MVDTTGTVRRLQALAAIGWPLNELAERLGARRQTLRKLMLQERCTTATRDKVAALYDELSMTVRGNAKAMTWARKRGFVPPLMWDDADLDDPAAMPHVAEYVDTVDELAVQAVLEGHRMELSGATAHAAVHALYARGVTTARIGERCGIDERQVERLKARKSAPHRRAAA